MVDLERGSGRDWERVVWLVTGVPAAGKTATAHALAQRAASGVHIEGDRLQRLIVSGNVPPSPQASAQSRRQIELNVRNQCLLAGSFADSGFTVVMDYVVTTRNCLDTYRRLLTPRAVGLVVLCPDLIVASQRDRARQDKSVLAEWLHLADEMRAELRECGLWLDNARLPVDAVVAHILSRVDEAMLAGPWQ